MESAIFKTVLQVESGQNGLLNAPERVVTRNPPGVPREDPIELTSISQSRNGSAPSSAATPKEEMVRDLERSRPVTATGSPDVIYPLQSFSDPAMNKYRVLACCLLNFMGGLNDSAAGALIPYIER